METEIINKLVAAGFEKSNSWIFVEQCLLLVGLNENAELLFDESFLEKVIEYRTKTISWIPIKLPYCPARLYGNDLQENVKIRTAILENKVPGLDFQKLQKWICLELTMSENRSTFFHRKPVLYNAVLYDAEPRRFFDCFVDPDLPLKRI